MKKMLYFLMATLVLINVPLVAQEYGDDGYAISASKEIFDWDPFDSQKILDLFYQAKKQGRDYPTQEELEAFGLDIEFVRSHVRPAEVIRNQETQVNPNIDPDRSLWMNIPTGKGSGIGGYPSSDWNNDAYTMWPYTKLYGAWNHSWFQAPGVWANAAHKHGTDMFSGIKFFDTTAGDMTQGAGSFLQYILEKEGGDFKYAEPLINALMYLGLDGVNYNFEASGVTNPDLQDFHARLYELAAQKGFSNFHVGFYSMNSNLSGSYEGNFYKNGKRVCDALMLNYSGGDFSYYMEQSVDAAKRLTGSANGLYGSTWLVSLNRSWTRLNASEKAKEINICLWGEHKQSRILSYTQGKSDLGFQENYQERLERFFSGGNRNPANTPAIKNTGNNIEDVHAKDGTFVEKAMKTFHGLASFIAERSAVKGKLPFMTNFNVGNGPQYNFKGKRAFDQWYNIGAQDMQPTYRWLVYNSNTQIVSNNIQPKLSHRDAYMGGSMLVLEGTATTLGSDVLLYRSDLEIGSGNPKARVAFKMVGGKSGTPTNLYLILKTAENEVWKEYPVGNTSKTTWDMTELNLEGLTTGDHIVSIGFRVKAESDVPDYQVFIGELKLSDDRSEIVEKPQNLKVEVKEETTASMSVKLNWNMNRLAGASVTRKPLIYNDEINVDHFEIFYKNGEKGLVKEIGRTNSWSHFIGDMILEEGENPFVGVRSASVDLKTVSPIVWVQIPRADELDLPTREISRYCESKLDPNANGADVARVQRYLVSATTTGLSSNLDYSTTAPPAEGNGYVDYTHRPITVTQGETFDFHFLANNASDGLKWCFATAYVDWNNDGDFDPENGEEVFQLGTLRQGTPQFQDGGVTQTFSVPTNARPGTVRIRLVFSDAWFPQPGPCGLTAKGFSIDFGMIINGVDPGQTSTSFRDEGEPEQPEQWDLTDDNTGTSVAKDMVSGVSRFYPNPTKDILYFEQTDRVLIYNLSGVLVSSSNGEVHSMDISELPEGIYIVKMEKGSVIRSRRLIKN